MSSADPIRLAVQQLSRFPGVGQKTATRLAYWLLRAPEGTAKEIAEALLVLEASVTECSICCNLTAADPCTLCADQRRDPTVLCVVEQPQDIGAFERSGEFRGGYHVLHGSLSPLDGIGPDDLRVRELIARLHSGEVKEVILATDPNVEGDATALYIGRLLKNVDVVVSRLAHGISVGTEIEYADAVSLARALQNRRAL